MASFSPSTTRTELSRILDHVDSVHGRLGLSLDPHVKKNVESMSDDIYFALNVLQVAQSNPLFSQLSQQCDPLRHIQDVLRRCGLNEPHLSSFLFRIVAMQKSDMVIPIESDICDESQLEGQRQPSVHAGDTDDCVSSSSSSRSSAPVDWELKSDSTNSDSSCSVESSSDLTDEDEDVIQTRKGPGDNQNTTPSRPSIWAEIDPMCIRRASSPVAEQDDEEEKRPAVSDGENEDDAFSKRFNSGRHGDPIVDPRAEDEAQQWRIERKRMYQSHFENAHHRDRLDLSVGRMVQVYHAPWRCWIDGQVIRVNGSYVTIAHVGSGKEVGTFHRNSSCIHVPSRPRDRPNKLSASARDLTEDSRDVRSLADVLVRRGIDLNVQRWDFETVSFVLGTMYEKKGIDRVFRSNKIRGSHLIDRAFNYHVVRDLFGRSRAYEMIGDAMEFVFVVRKLHDLRHVFRSEFGGRYHHVRRSNP